MTNDKNDLITCFNDHINNTCVHTYMCVCLKWISPCFSGVNTCEKTVTLFINKTRLLLAIIMTQRWVNGDKVIKSTADGRDSGEYDFSVSRLIERKVDDPRFIGTLREPITQHWSGPREDYSFTGPRGVSTESSLPKIIDLGIFVALGWLHAFSGLYDSGGC